MQVSSRYLYLLDQATIFIYTLLANVVRETKTGFISNLHKILEARQRKWLSNILMCPSKIAGENQIHLVYCDFHLHPSQGTLSHRGTKLEEG